MADFSAAYERMIKDEGGYRLTDIKGDRGGKTYAGIAQKMHPEWPGWSWIDRGETPPSELVREFYLLNFWRPIRGDELPQKVANAIFNFAVNAGIGIAVKLAQLAVGQTPDGLLGTKTVKALNGCNADTFVLQYALAKIARYRDIVTRDKTQAKFLLGWINRTLAGLA